MKKRNQAFKLESLVSGFLHLPPPLHDGVSAAAAAADSALGSSLLRAWEDGGEGGGSPTVVEVGGGGVRGDACQKKGGALNVKEMQMQMVGRQVEPAPG